jgi:hypothetical protein
LESGPAKYGVLLVKNKCVTYSLEVPACCIEDGRLRVKDIKELAVAHVDLALLLQINLLHKGQQLMNYDKKA